MKEVGEDGGCFFFALAQAPDLSSGFLNSTGNGLHLLIASTLSHTHVYTTGTYLRYQLGKALHDACTLGFLSLVGRSSNQYVKSVHMILLTGISWRLSLGSSDQIEAYE